MDTIFEGTQLIYFIKWFIMIEFLLKANISSKIIFIRKIAVYILQFLQYLPFRVENAFRKKIINNIRS